MKQYEHIPIYRVSYDLAVYLEKTVRNFSRYNKYTLGSELRNGSRQILHTIVLANTDISSRSENLTALSYLLENFKTTVRLAHEVGALASTRQYLYIAEQVASITRQNEGWLKQTRTARAGLNIRV